MNGCKMPAFEICATLYALLMTQADKSFNNHLNVTKIFSIPPISFKFHTTLYALLMLQS